MPVIRIALAGVLALAVVVLTATVGALGTVDTSIRNWVIDRRSPGRTPLMTALTTVGSSPVLVTLAVGVAVWLFIARERREALLVVVTTAGALVLDPLLKVLVGRARPADAHLVLVNSGAYPSGHSLHSAAVIGVLVVLAVRHLAARWARVAVVTLGVLLVLGVGVSRVYLGVHWPTDVLAGWLIGALWLAVCVLVISWTGPVRRGSPRR
ncbi:phosphatase PAP2 family protein [Actinophytocola sp.]|uniref:phosphatase PAP2 family protein n=1 Tax=Actinophytocola sp. TaxID=1872138 RepID=UPI002ED8FDCD